jgi:hypothetical protein
MAKHFCYRNLNRKGVVWSAKNTKTGLVELREEFIVLRNVALKVSQAGRARVLRDKRKNVHAGAVGEIITARQLPRMWKPDKLRWVRASYNPYKMESFCLQSIAGASIPVYEAKFALLTKNGLWISDTSYPTVGLTLKEIREMK